MTTFEIIQQIKQEKEALHRFPSYATGFEIYNRAKCFYLPIGVVDAELAMLVEFGKVKIGNTINDKYYKI